MMIFPVVLSISYRIMPYDTQCSAKILIDSFYSVGGIGCETPEVVTDLPMKNGFVREMLLTGLFISFLDKENSL